MTPSTVCVSPPQIPFDDGGVRMVVLGVRRRSIFADSMKQVPAAHDARKGMPHAVT